MKCLYGRIDFNIHDFVEFNPRYTESILFKHKFARTNSFKYSLFNRFPRLWQGIPDDVRNLSMFNFNAFVTALRLFIRQL